MTPKTLKEQNNNIEARSPEEIKKSFPFVITREYKGFSEWHGRTVTYTEYGFKKDDIVYWFARRTTNRSQWWAYDKIITILKTLQESEFKYSCSYCAAGVLGDPNRFTDPLVFIAQVLKEKHTFTDMTSIQEIKPSHWCFSGNLNERSAAFHFDIFDKKLVEQISKQTNIEIMK